MSLPFRFRRVVQPALFALLLSAGSASAHPHVFIDYTVTVLFDDNAAQAVRVSWTFDEMYSSMLLHDYTSLPPRDALTPAVSSSEASRTPAARTCCTVRQRQASENP